MATGTNPTATYASKSNQQAENYLFPLILVTSLFFMWGLAYGLLDSLNKHFQDLFGISKAASGMLQLAYFGGYFLMALPAGRIMKKFGYKKGILLGLSLYAGGALLGALFLNVTAGNINGYFLFLLAMFILACGLCCLETASNPYVTVLGPPETSEFRLNMSQCFNGVGSFLGPFIASYLFFGGNEVAVITGQGSIGLQPVLYTYLIIGIVVLILVFLFKRAHLPEINEEQQLTRQEHHHSKSLFSNSHFVWGIVAQFFYVAAQVGVAAFFINYTIANWQDTTPDVAARLLGLSLVLFTIGRFAGTFMMKYIKPSKLLAIFSIINVALCLYMVLGTGALTVYSLMIVFFFESIMFPTIFALAVKDLGKHTRQGGSFIIMSIVGGAVSPLVMGLIADKTTISISYIVPLICFVVVFFYGWKGYKIKHDFPPAPKQA